MDGAKPKILEGLRLLVWWHYAIRKGLVGDKATCSECMERCSVQDRQMAGCGYLPKPGPELLPYVRPWSGLGYAGDAPTQCPGYTTNLPEVQEVARAHLHWSKGALVPWLQGKDASEALLSGIEILELESHKFQNWLTDEASKKTGQ